MIALNELNTRLLQVYGAICLWKFCKVFDIRHKDIDTLLSHLVSICIVKSLPDWEQAGVQITITGRGDGLPGDIVSIIPEELMDTFTILIEYVIEIGIVDMYGDNTDLPFDFTHHCIDILTRYGIDAPDHTILVRYNNPSGRVWGNTISKESLHEILRFYDIDLVI